MSAVSRGTYKDQEALILENESARAVLLPEWGAKTISLVHKGLGIETLWQNPEPKFRRTVYGDPYGDGEFAGFDEMFPTVSRCYYESPPWAGIEAPDHGEVWTVPWETAIEGDLATLSVHGTRFPYTLRKTVSLDGARLVARYAAENLSSEPMDFIWAAHPLFIATEGMRFIVPRGMTKAINAVPGLTLGSYGRELDFPLARGEGGGELRLDRVPKRNTTGYQKYWFAEKATEGWCMLRDDNTTLTIGLAFSRETVPYLGMWLNEGGYGGQYNIAPEPATAAMDRLDFARMWGKGSILPPKSRVEWELVIALAEGREPVGMNEDGGFRY
jgi:galactose mutarotase-like enzyme